MAQITAKGILFVSHDASRSGSPIALLHFLRWFKTNGDRAFSILLPFDGELTPAFAELAETWSIDRSRWCPGRLRTSLLNRLGLDAWARRAEIADIQRFAARCSPGLVYVNSIASARVIDRLGPIRVPIMTHVHELEYFFRLGSGPALSSLLGRTKKFIACSNAVKENLVREHGVAPEKVETIYESIPVDQVRAERTRQQVLEELRVPYRAALIIGGGANNWRKGADLFIQLARLVCQYRPDVYFVWIGGSACDIAELDYDVRAAGLVEKVRITGVVSRPADYFAAADVFVLTSREDPYPLVCLEAAALGKPIVSFAGAGGMPEFVEDDCGFVVPYLDVGTMAQRVICLLDSPDLRVAIGEKARRKVAQRHDVSVSAPRIMEVVERTIEAS